MNIINENTSYSINSFKLQEIFNKYGIKLTYPINYDDFAKEIYPIITTVTVSTLESDTVTNG